LPNTFHSRPIQMGWEWVPASKQAESSTQSYTVRPLNQGLTDIIPLNLAHLDPLYHAFERLKLTHQVEQLINAG
jgi:hypothetical protein